MTQTDDKRMMEKLPKRLDPGVSYSVPEDLLDDAGSLFAYTCAVCYGKKVNALVDHFDVTRQAFWVWRHVGKGVPGEYREALQSLIDDPAQPFRLPENATIDDFLRASTRGGAGPTAPKPKRNDHLLDLLDRICTSRDAGFGRSMLYRIMDVMSRSVSNPFIFYRWGYLHGGVPSTYAQPFVAALAVMNIAQLYGLDYPDFEQWAKANLIAPDDEPVGLEKENADGTARNFALTAE